MRRTRSRVPTGNFRSEIFLFDQMLDIEWCQEYDSIDGLSMEIYTRDIFTKHFLETLTEAEYDRLTEKLYQRSLDMREAADDYDTNEALDRLKE